MSDTQDSTIESGDNILSIKLPSYGVHNPRLWFAQVESIFDFRRIKSQQTKYSCIVAHLPSEVAVEIADLIYDRPPLNPYDTLKSALINRTAATDEQNLRVLLAGVEMGDRTPSQLLRHMTQLQGNQTVNEAILKELWLQNLPADIRKVLSIVDKDTTMLKLAELADQVFSCYGAKASTSIQAVASTSPCSEIETLKQQFSDLSLQLAKVTAILTERPRSTSRSRSVNRRMPFRRDTSTIICRYHRRFGSKARNCIKPCCYEPAQGNVQAR